MALPNRPPSLSPTQCNPPPPLPPIPPPFGSLCSPPLPPPPLSSPTTVKPQPRRANSIDAAAEFTEAKKRLWDLEGWEEPPLLMVYRYLPPILQEGPQCGIVALAMAAASTDWPRSVDSLLSEAKMHGFSRHGEMFSVDNKAYLAKSAMPLSKISIIESLSSNRDFVIHQLARGSILLVPYDADCNHEPNCLRGHKAHWAAVCGALVSTQGYFVTARQGKSSRLMLWDYSKLAASNGNLTELCPNRLSDGYEYLLPPGGVRAGLCGRSVLIEL